jgi:hypothetical protein
VLSRAAAAQNARPKHNQTKTKQNKTHNHNTTQHNTKQKDDTLNGLLCFDAQAVAHETDVLYVNVPDDMVGGRLNLWPVGTDDDDPAAPFHTVEPVEGKVLRFRGDAIHKVYRHGSAKGTARVSLVIEQYKWPEKWASLVPPFWVKGQVNDNDALLPLWLDGSLPLPLEALPRDRRPWGKQAWPEREP